MPKKSGAGDDEAGEGEPGVDMRKNERGPGGVMGDGWAKTAGGDCGAEMGR